MKKEQHDSLVKKILNRWDIELAAYQEAFADNAKERTDRVGNPLTYPEWVVLSNDQQYYVISKENIDENVYLLTLWHGYPEVKYTTAVVRNDQVYALIITENESAAHKVHEEAGFYLDQKIWEFEDI